MSKDDAAAYLAKHLARAGEEGPGRTLKEQYMISFLITSVAFLLRVFAEQGEIQKKAVLGLLQAWRVGQEELLDAQLKEHSEMLDSPLGVIGKVVLGDSETIRAHNVEILDQIETLVNNVMKIEGFIQEDAADGTQSDLSEES